MILFGYLNVWLFLSIVRQISGISYNQPKLCANATWNQTAITFATSTLVGTHPLGIFVDTNNTVYVADYTDGRILIWLNGSTTLTGNISSGLTTPYPLFVTDNGDLYVGNAYSNYRVDKWAWNTTNSVPAMYICSICYGIFVDINNMLYCSIFSYHQVIYKSLTQNLNVWSNVAGISGTAGSTSTTLNTPCGIFVDTYLNLYVADWENSRIQKFASGQLNGTTISTGAITLYHPSGVILDGGGYVFIVDSGNSRIIGSGPNGFRCIMSCSGSGSSSSQLNIPQNTTAATTNATTMMSIVQTTTASTFVSYSNVISFNQPKFSAYATWDAVAITFANSSTVGTSPYGIFVDTNNTVYVANKASNQIQVWLSGSSTPTRSITTGITSPYSIFATINGDIYVDNGYTNNRVDKWVSNQNISSSVMQVQGACYDLFIDVNNTLYCSLYTQNQVVIKSLNGNSSMWIVAAGTECSGSTSNTLSSPRGIFVDTNLNLYVADCGNNRVQLFLSGQVTATTVAGSTAAGTILVSCPSDVALDNDGYLFIVDSTNNRIIGSGPNGFRCIIGCGTGSGSTSTQLSSPSTFSFDSYGNIFITDQGNSRVQKFMSIPNTTYHAITFANSSIAGNLVYGVFVDTDNTVYVANQQTNKVLVWFEGSTNPDKILSGSLSTPYDLFATSLGDIYVDNGLNNYEVDKFSLNSNISTSVMSVPFACYGIFVDISNTLYCSTFNSYQVVKKWLNDSVLTSTIVAGTGTPGSTATTLNNPVGVFVDAQFNLYVADRWNNRIQMFPVGQLAGITVAGATAPGTITLNQPYGITCDGNGYLFIADCYNHRIVGSGPYGFRCLFGCTGTGSTPSQFNYPATLRFDSYGNLYVADRNNNRVQKFILASNSCSLSYNQPTFCSNALWFSNASTFATNSTIGTLPYGIFIDGINTVYVPNKVSNTILSWPQWSTTSTSNSYSNLSSPYSLFMSITGDIYIDNGYSYGRVDKYIFNTSDRVTVMNVNGSCYGLFIDINNNLYCSLKNLHQVVKLLLNNGTTIPTIAAGNGSAGSLSNMLNSPQGIYVDSNLNLYIADCANNRIQFVQTGQLNGVTVVGNGSSANITLNYPTGIVLDANGYLFIVDSYNHRIVASSSTGFQCILGCSGGGSSASQLSFPQSMAFDSYGNIYVTDRNNSRQYRPPPPLLLRAAAAAVSPLELLLLPQPVPQAVVLQAPLPPPPVPPVPPVALLLLVPVPQVVLPLAVLLRVVVVTPAALLVLRPVPQVVLQPAPQAAVLQVALLPLPLPPQVQQQVAAAPQVVLPRAAVVPQVALLPRPPLAVLQQAVAAPQAVVPQVAPLQAAAVLQVLLLLPLPPAVLQVALLPLPQVLQQVAAAPQVPLLRAALVPQVAAAPQVPLLRAALVPQVAPLQAAAVLQVVLLRAAVAPLLPQQVAAVLRVAPLQAVAVLQVVVLLLPAPPLVLQQVALLPRPPQAVPLRVVSALQVAVQRVVAVLQVALLPVAAALRVASLPAVAVSQVLSKRLMLKAQHKFTKMNLFQHFSFEIILNEQVMTTFSELYIPSRTLNYGVYQLTLTVTMIDSPNLKSSSSVYVRITATGITANLVQLGTSMITRGNQQDLLLDPGTFSVDPNEGTFDATKWKYTYYCRIYGLYNFPNVQGILLSIDDSTIDPYNPSCLSSRSGNGTGLIFGNLTLSPNSSLTVLGGSLQLNQIYQFMVYMENRKNSSIQGTGYVFVTTEVTHPQLIAVG
ncbi:unnamed protein product, partial [Adineta steineri]